MLVLSRKPNQSIVIGSDVRVIVVGVDGEHVKLGIEAPPEVSVHRYEIFEEIRRGSRAGAPRAGASRAGKGPAPADSPVVPSAGGDGETRRTG